jgi:hypothetical protein
MISLRKRRLRVVLASAIAASATVAAMTGRADDTPIKPTGASTPAPAALTAPPAALHPARPYWLDLTPPQRDALGPLVNDWEHLDNQTKKKWVEIANRYPHMKPEEQSRIQERMREWAMLTPEQRRVARDSYERIKSMPPEKRADMLRQYRELPAEKREALASQPQIGKAIVMPKSPTMVAPTVARRMEIREGAKVRNPAIAAQKSASPIVVPPARGPKPMSPPGSASTPPPATSATAPVTVPTSATKPAPTTPSAPTPTPAPPPAATTGKPAS